MIVEMTKEYRTRDGHEVRLYAVNQSGLFPVHGAIRSTSGFWFCTAWTEEGRNRIDCPNHVHDLVEAPARIRTTAWVSVYKVFDKYMFGVYESHKQAQQSSAQDCLAIVNIDIDCEQGEGIKEALKKT
jgi:hypothetical protein